MSLSCSGMSRVWAWLARGDLEADSGTLSVLEEGRAFRLAGVGASGMCGKGVVSSGCMIKSPPSSLILCHLVLCSLSLAHTGWASSCLRAFVHAKSSA